MQARCSEGLLLSKLNNVAPHGAEIAGEVQCDVSEPT
jgi:hypothetical protein